MDTKSIIEKMIAVEKKKVEPIIQRQEKKSLELDAWKQVKVHLDTVKGTADSLSKKSLWEGKLVTSSNPDVVEATATSGAKPGKHTLVVDKLALSHQVASQNFENKDSQIGRGKVTISIGDGPDQVVTIDETNDTLQGFVDAINAVDADLQASVIKTGNKERPWQVVLTSSKTGQEGEIFVSVDLKVEEGQEAPTFDPYYLQPGRWNGVKQEGDKGAKQPTGTGASTAIPELIGEYSGAEPLDLTFTVVNTGIVGESENLKMRWEDNQGRFGYLDLDSFNYTPGEPVEIVDGISLIMGFGEILVNDTFKASAKPLESELYWWKDSAEREAKITQPASWGKQSAEGGPQITGKMDSEDDDFVTLKVVGSGQVGQGDLKIEYESENGLKGFAFIGDGYTAGTKVSLGRGLELSLNSGILNDGDYATFEYQAESTADYWWLDDEDRSEGGQIKNITNRISPEREEGEEVAGIGGGLSAGDTRRAGPKVSNVEKQIVGKYDSFESKVYTFTAMDSGTIGTTTGIRLKWEDSNGETGILTVGDTYQPGTAIEFDSGLSLVLGEGQMFETDSFSFRTFSPVIQPPQDAEVRLGATELGGGLLVTSPTNVLDDVIEGVKLNLLSIDEKPVTISIKGDTEKALAGIKEFAAAYNEMLNFFGEVSKYDKDADAAAPLQGDRNLPRIQSETAQIFIDTVSGLDTDSNMLFNIGLKINAEGLIDLDEDKLTNAINDDLGKVANLFRSYGQTENSAITFLSAGVNTDISGPDGFDIDVTQAATKGYYNSKPLPQAITIDSTNDTLYVKVNGRESEEMKFEHGTFTPGEFAQKLQKAVLDDKYLSKMKVAVTINQGQITIRSNTSGERSKVEVRTPSVNADKLHFLTGGEEVVGQDVQGRIGDVELIGAGQILSGPEGSAYDGLKLYVELSETQITEGVEAKMVVTKGVGTKVMEYITELMDGEKGALGIYTQNVEDQLEGYKKEVKILEDRLTEKREKLVMKFARMESKLGQLKSEQSYLTKELAKIG